MDEIDEAFEAWLRSYARGLPPEERVKWIPPRELARQAFLAGWSIGYQDGNGKQNDDE